MKKILLSAALLMGVVFSSQAQEGGKEGFHFGAGIDVALPVGDLGDIGGVGFGPKVQGEYRVSENFGAGLSVAYTFFTKKNEISTSALPVLAHGRYYTSGGFFAGVGLGVTSNTQKFDFGGTSVSGTTSAFTYEPHIGYELPSIQLSLGYYGSSKNGGTLAYLGLSGVYVF